MKAQPLPVDDISLDGNTQARAALDEDAIEDYRQLILGGEALPAIDVYYDGVTYWLADGFHRWFAYKKVPCETIPCTVHNGTQGDAQWHAIRANQSHGVRRTEEDKARACQMGLLHPNAEGKSDRELARLLGISNGYVSKMHRRLIRDGELQEEGEEVEEDDPFPDEPTRTGKQAEPALDAFGNPWPDKLLSDLVQCRDAKLDAGDLTRISKSWKERDDERMPITMQMDVKALRKELSFASKRIKASMPYCLCPLCDGKGCKFCKTCGWLTKNAYKLVPQDKQYRTNPR